MTPERRQEIQALHKMYSENLACQPQHAVNVLVDCVRDLTIDNDSLTAEIATLRTQRDALVKAGENIGEWMPILMARWQEMGNTELPRNMREAHVAKALVAMSRKVDALAAAVREAKGGDREFCVIINGKVLWHDRDVLTYDDVFRWYSMGRSFQSAVLLTVTFSNGPKENPFGSLTRGQSICVCDGLIINVTIT